MSRTPAWYEPHVGVKQRRRAERRVQVRELYEMGHSINEIAAILDCSNSTVTNDVTALGIGNRNNGASARIYNPTQALSRIIGQLDDTAHALQDVLERLGRHPYKIDPDTLEIWDEALNRRANITAVITHLRRYLKEQQDDTST